MAEHEQYCIALALSLLSDVLGVKAGRLVTDMWA